MPTATIAPPIMRIILPPARIQLRRLVLVGALCVPASLFADGESADKTSSPPPVGLAVSYPLPLPPLEAMLTLREAVLKATTALTPEDRLVEAERILQEKTAAAAPLIEATGKAEAALAPAQTALAAAEQEAASLQKSIDALVDEIAEITASRAKSETERVTTSDTLAKLQQAQPLVSEALRHLTEAVGKAPGDATLTEAHRQLTEKLKAMEANVAELQKKVSDLIAAVAAADSRLKDTNAQLDAGRQQSAVVAERVAGLQSEVGRLTAALDAARKTAEPGQRAVSLAQREVDRWKSEILLRDQIAALEAELAAARKLADQRQTELDETGRQLAAAKSAFDSAAAQLDDASRSVEAITARIHTAHEQKSALATEITETKK